MKDKIGKYQIIETYRGGGMGIVYKAKDPSLNRIVALKTIPQEYKNTLFAQSLFARFAREAEIEGMINHQNIVTVYEYNETVPFICMEFVEGERLDEIIKRIKTKEVNFSLDQLINIMYQLLDILDFAHNKQIVHRDINPTNIMLTPDGILKLTDFGIAKIATDEYSITSTDQTLGTMQYSSLEQLLVGEKVDHRTDIFSAGMILYEFLTGGEKAFDILTSKMEGSELERRQKYYHSRFTSNPQNPSEINYEINPAFDNVVQKALQKLPKDRFQTAKEFWQALHEAYQSTISLPTDRDKSIFTYEKRKALRQKIFENKNRYGWLNSEKFYLITIILLVIIIIIVFSWNINRGEKPSSSSENIPENIVDYGLLNISTDKPGFNIYINGKKQEYTTPVAHLKVPAGNVKIMVVDNSRGIERSIETLLHPNELRQIGKQELNL